MTLFTLATALLVANSTFGQNGASSSAVVLVDARDHIGSIQDYISQQKANLAIGGKEKDIFGLPQDPKKAKALEVATKAPEREVKKPTLPLQRVLDALPLTMMDPVGNRVIVNGKPPLRAGENLELTVAKETLTLRLEGVRSNGAYFRDLSTGELGLRSMTKLPEGIQRGGVRPDGPKEIQRIDLDQPQAIKVNLDLANGNKIKN